MKRTTRLAPMSARRRRAIPERARVVAEVHARDVRCMASGMPGVPHGPVPDRGRLEVHEVIPRSAWAAGWLEPGNCVLLCPRAHDWVGDHPELAHGLGLHGYSYERPISWERPS